MTFSILRSLFCMAASAVLLSLASGVIAQEAYPAKPIRLIVPFPPGGSSGAMAHVLAQELTQRLGQQVLVDNRGGASGNIGAVQAAKAPADGYTLFWGTGGTHGINPAIYKNAGFDPIKDFTPIVLALNAPNVIVVNPSFPATNLKQLIDLAKASPGKYNAATAGVGSTPAMMGELFKYRAGVEIVQVQYQGSGPALTDVIAGHVPIMFDGLPSALPHIKNGRLRALAISSATRHASEPEIPTISETLPGFEAPAWWALFAPAGTPRYVVDRLNREVNTILATSEAQKRYAEFGAATIGGTPERLRDLVKSELARWSELMRVRPVKVD